MNFRDLYRHNTARNILLRGALGLSAGLIFGALYSSFTGQNEIARFSAPIFFVPITLTMLNLLFVRSICSGNKGKDKVESSEVQ